MPDVELLWFYGYSSTCENPCGHETEADRCVCVSVCLVECSAVWSLLLSQLYTNTHHKVVSRSTESASQLSCLSTVNCSR